MFLAAGTHLKYTIAETNSFKKLIYFILQKYLVNICSSIIFVYSFMIILQGQTFILKNVIKQIYLNTHL